MIWKHFSKTSNGNMVWSWFKNNIFKVCANYTIWYIWPSPHLSLVTEAPYVVGLFRFFINICESRNVKSIGFPAFIVCIFQSGQHSYSPHTIVVVHQVMAKLTAVISQSVWKSFRTAV